MAYQAKLITGAAVLAWTVQLFASSELVAPPGSKLAIVVFEDLQCAGCAEAHGDLLAAAREFKIPLIRHDFPLPLHDWARTAAVMARYFDSRGEDLGSAFRSYIFANQASIQASSFRQTVNGFCTERGIQPPSLPDYDRKFERMVDADIALGTRLGVTHTPAVFIVDTHGNKTEVADKEELLQVLGKARVATNATAKRTHRNSDCNCELKP
jgi:protein-disulfide isomerase